MYRNHVPPINATMRGSVDGFKRGCMFAILSIRQPITVVPDQLAAIVSGDLSPLFGHKVNAYSYLEEHGAALHRDVCALKCPLKAIERLLDVPGLGIVKAAFICQFLGFNVACLDTRNVKREGRNPRAFRTDGKSPDKLRKKVAAYVAETRGKARFYWDAWCKDVAVVYKLTAEEISELHLAICAGPQVELEDTF